MREGVRDGGAAVDPETVTDFQSVFAMLCVVLSKALLA